MAKPATKPAARAPSGYELERVMSEVGKIKRSLSNDQGVLDIDLEDFLQVLDEDTDLMSILDQFEYLISTKKDYAERARNRAATLTRQADAGRRVFLAILEQLGVRKLQRPNYDALIAKGRTMLAIDDADMIPFDFLVPVPDKRAIEHALKAGETVAGARLIEAAQQLRILRGTNEEQQEEGSPTNGE